MSEEIENIFSFAKSKNKKLSKKKNVDNDKTNEIPKNDETTKDDRDKLRTVKKKTKTNSSDSSDFEIRGTNAKTRRYTDDGFAIYDISEIKFGKNAGDTEDCPFDCDCCY